jgi:hypothetical protein
MRAGRVVHEPEKKKEKNVGIEAPRAIFFDYQCAF